eukprot:9211643-Pyramimonas_sp.AAC.1
MRPPTSPPNCPGSPQRRLQDGPKGPQDGPTTLNRAERHKERKRACARGRVGSSGRPPRYDCASPRGTRLRSRPTGPSYCLRWHILSY